MIFGGVRTTYECSGIMFKYEGNEFEQEDEWNGLPISTPPYTICAKCNHNKYLPIDYKSKKGFHHVYKEK